MPRIDIRQEEVWARMYCQYFARPYDFDPEMIARTLDIELGNWDRSTLIKTMQWMTSAGQKWSKSPGGRELAIAYKMHNRRTEAMPVRTPEGFVNFVKSRMLRATTFADRWNIMCSPDLYAGAERTTTGEECDTLHVWASGEWEEWHRPTLEEIANMPTSDESKGVPF